MLNVAVTSVRPQRLLYDLQSMEQSQLPCTVHAVGCHLSGWQWRRIISV